MAAARGRRGRPRVGRRRVGARARVALARGAATARRATPAGGAAAAGAGGAGAARAFDAAARTTCRSCPCASARCCPGRATCSTWRTRVARVLRRPAARARARGYVHVKANETVGTLMCVLDFQYLHERRHARRRRSAVGAAFGLEKIDDGRRRRRPRRPRRRRPRRRRRRAVGPRVGLLVAAQAVCKVRLVGPHAAARADADAFRAADARGAARVASDDEVCALERAPRARAPLSFRDDAEAPPLSPLALGPRPVPAPLCGPRRRPPPATARRSPPATRRPRAFAAAGARRPRGRRVGRYDCSLQLSSETKGWAMRGPARSRPCSRGRGERRVRRARAADCDARAAAALASAAARAGRRRARRRREQRGRRARRARRARRRPPARRTRAGRRRARADGRARARARRCSARRRRRRRRARERGRHAALLEVERDVWEELALFARLAARLRTNGSTRCRPRCARSAPRGRRGARAAPARVAVSCALAHVLDLPKGDSRQMARARRHRPRLAGLRRARAAADDGRRARARVGHARAPPAERA